MHVARWESFVPSVEESEHTKSVVIIINMNWTRECAVCSRTITAILSFFFCAFIAEKRFKLPRAVFEVLGNWRFHADKIHRTWHFSGKYSVRNEAPLAQYACLFAMRMNVDVWLFNCLISKYFRFLLASFSQKLFDHFFPSVIAILLKYRLKNS